MDSKKRKRATRAERKTIGGKRNAIEGIYKDEEVADILAKSLPTIRRYAAQGALVPVRVKGCRYAIGYTAASVRALAEGRTK